MPAKLTWTTAKERAEKKCAEKGLTFLSEEGEWKGTTGYVRVECKTHGEYKVLYSNLVNKDRGCKQCLSLTWKIARDRAEKACAKKGLTFLSEEKEWKGAGGYVRVKCETHEEYKVTYNRLVNEGTGCKRCNGTSKKSAIEVSKVFEAEDYKVNGVYKNVGTPLKLLCPTGHECSISVDHFIRDGSRCQECKRIDGLSGGARNVRLVLEELKLNYSPEFRTDEMPLMPFDFVVSQDNKALFIEYDGIIHFTGWNGDEKDKLKVQAYDKKKTDFIRFLPNNFHMIRISNPNKAHIKGVIERYLSEKDFPKIYFDDEEKYQYLAD